MTEVAGGLVAFIRARLDEVQDGWARELYEQNRELALYLLRGVEAKRCRDRASGLRTPAVSCLNPVQQTAQICPRSSETPRKAITRRRGFRRSWASPTEWPAKSTSRCETNTGSEEAKTMWEALIAFGLMLAIITTIITHATLRIAVFVIAAITFLAAGLNALGVFTG